MSVNPHTESKARAGQAFPIGTFYGAALNFSFRPEATGWDATAQSFHWAMHALAEALKRAGRSLDGGVVSILAKRWRDEGAEIVASRLAAYRKARAAVLQAETTDPENIGAKFRMLAEMLDLPDPWDVWREEGPSQRLIREDPEAALAAAVLGCIYRDLRACRREMDTLRKRAAKRRKG